jgi:hypothetical protein
MEFDEMGLQRPFGEMDIADTGVLYGIFTWN